MSKSLNPDQARQNVGLDLARHNVGPDLCQNFLQRLLADDIRSQRVKE